MQLVRIVGPAADVEDDALGRAGSVRARRALRIGEQGPATSPYSAACRTTGFGVRSSPCFFMAS